MNLDLRDIPAIYINLPQHTEKDGRMQVLLNQCGFKHILRVDGVDRPDNPVAGCSAAHYKALCVLKPPFVLFEDDCVLKQFRPRIEVPDDADAVYLGVSSWGRMNGHSGPYVRYAQVGEDLYRVYNMLGGHAILYLTDEYVRMCQRVARHAGYVIQDYADIGFAEIQRWFSVYALGNPLFYQTSAYHGTVESLTSYPTEECLSYDPKHFRPQRIDGL